MKQVLALILFAIGVISLSGCSKPPANTLIAKAESMIEDDSIKELGRDDLVTIFGEPNADGYFSSWDNAFWLGFPDDTYAIDSNWLVVNYGDGGLVEEAKIAMD